MRRAWAPNRKLRTKSRRVRLRFEPWRFVMRAKWPRHARDQSHERRFERAANGRRRARCRLSHGGLAPLREDSGGRPRRSDGANWRPPIEQSPIPEVDVRRGLRSEIASARQLARPDLQG